MTDSRTEGRDAAADTAGVRRSIISRRSLPNGRALVGALLVTVAAAGAFVFASSDGGPDNEYLVLLRDVDAGGLLSAADVAYEPMTLSPQLADIAFSAASNDTTDQLEGATALRFLHAGALLLAPDLRGADPILGAEAPKTHELTLPVPLDRTPAVLARGDRVAVLAYDSRNESTWTAVEDGLVLRYAAAGDSIGSSSHGRLTLALSDPQRVLRGAHLSFLELTVVLTTRAADDGYPRLYRGPLPPDPTDEQIDSAERSPLAEPQSATEPAAPAPPDDTGPANKEEFLQ